MRLSKPNSTLANTLPLTIRRFVVEAVSILREMVRIPAALFMRVAEVAGAVVLRGWLVVWPLVRAAGRAALGALAALERWLTPARAMLGVAALVAVALGGSQFADYHDVTIGTPEYSGVESVAPPPAVDSETAGSAHLWLGIPLALAALAIIFRAATGRWRIARLLVAVGAAAVVISLAIDLPKGLDEGSAAVAYDGASAELLGGFWAQLVCGVVLIVLGLLLPRVLDPRTRAAAEDGPRRVRSLVPHGLGELRLPALPRRPRVARAGGGSAPAARVREARGGPIAGRLAHDGGPSGKRGER